MKVGDLVKIQRWCKNKGRFALIIEEKSFDKSRVRIHYFDEPREHGWAIKSNLELVSESR
mgnify:CR=1 FL=1